MASTSSYTQNDYQAVSTFRPYQLPINDIFKAITAQNAFWEQGAARVKSVYDSALNLDLTIAENRAIRDKFMQDAEKEIQKLSSMDLSDPSVQRQGFNIFKPLLQDQGVVSDSEATKHIKRVNSEALSYRNKDGGKGYNQLNHAYALDGSEEFRNAKDRMAGLKYLEKRKEYEPYHDYSAEYEKIIKNCPSSSDIGDSVLSDSGYIETTKIKERSTAKVRTCLEAGLSPKAYRQMQIEGYMNYKGRPETLRDDYIQFLSSSNGNISSEMQRLSGELEAINSQTGLSPEQKATAIQALSQQIDALQNETINQNNVITKLRAGDMTPIIGNEEAISGSLYQYRKILKQSYASAFRDYEHTYKPDPVSLQRFRYEQEVALRKLDFGTDIALRQLDHNYDLKLAEFEANLDMQLETIKQMGKSAGGGAQSNSALIWDSETRQLIINPNIEQVTAHYTDKDQASRQGLGYSALDDQLKSLNKQSADNDTYLYQKFVERGESDEGFRNRLTTAFGLDSWDKFKALGPNGFGKGGRQPLSETQWFKAYVAGSPNDPVVKKWNSVNGAVKVGAQIINTHLEEGERQVASRLGITINEGETPRQAIDRTLAGKLKDIPVTQSENDPNLQISPQEMLQLKKNGSLPGKNIMLETDEKGVTMVRTRTKSGKIEYDLPLSKMLAEIDRSVLKTSENIDKVREDVYTSIQFKSEPWFHATDVESPLAQQMQSAFSTEDADGKKRGVQIAQVDFEGGFKVRVPGLSDSEFEKAQSLGYGTGFVTRDPQDKDLLIFKNTNYMKLPSANMSAAMKNSAYILSSVPKSADFQKLRPGQKLAGKDVDFQMYDAQGNFRPIRIEIHKDVDGSPEYVVVDGSIDKTTGKPRNSVITTAKDSFAALKALQNINTFR